MKFSAILTALTATIATVAGYETSGKPHTVDILIDYSIKETQKFLKLMWLIGSMDKNTLLNMLLITMKKLKLPLLV